MEAYRDPARCSYPLHPFLSINAHCAPARVSEIFSYKLEIFSDGYANPKFIPHEIFLTEIYVNEKMIITVYYKAYIAKHMHVMVGYYVSSRCTNIQNRKR